MEKYDFIRPNEILFAYDAPDEVNSPLYPAFDEIRRQIEQAGIVMANASNENDIVSFAQH